MIILNIGESMENQSKALSFRLFLFRTCYLTTYYQNLFFFVGYKRLCLILFYLLLHLLFANAPSRQLLPQLLPQLLLLLLLLMMMMMAAALLHTFFFIQCCYPAVPKLLTIINYVLSLKYNPHNQTLPNYPTTQLPGYPVWSNTDQKKKNIQNFIIPLPVEYLFAPLTSYATIP